MARPLGRAILAGGRGFLGSRAFLGGLSVLVLVGGYAWLSHRQHRLNPEDSTIPTLSQLRDGVRMIAEVNSRSGERWVAVDTKATLERLAWGMGIGVLAAVGLGLWMGHARPAESFFLPPLSLLAKVPPTAALAVFFVMVGTDTEMYVAMIAFGILPTLAQSVHLAVKDVPEETIQKALTLGASRVEIIWDVIFSQVRPKVVDGIRLQIGPAMVYLIAAEMVCGDAGFGYRIRMQSRLLNMNVVYTYLALLAGFGFLMDLGLRGLIRAWCPWYVRGRN